jgi:DNA topoisomerase-1
MATAQRLYEQGLITYHRTDSVHLSETAISQSRKFIKDKYGDKYLPKKPRRYKTKAKVAQEAHEAIRPTEANREKKDLTKKGGVQESHKRLYELIWKRFVASQMTDCIFDQTKIEVLAKGEKEYLLDTRGRVMRFDGWRKVIPSSRSEDPELPDVNKSEKLDLLEVVSEQKFTNPPARFNEASLIKMLEKLGIGRPSTYAPIISTIQSRQYVEKDESRFKPTPIGITVNDFLLKYFPDVFDYSFTAQMEDELDEIAKGKQKWKTPIKQFWSDFDKKLEKTEKKAKRVKIETEKLGKKCPKCKDGELVIRVGKFGKFISCSRFPDCDYTEKYLEKIGMKCPDCKKGEVIVKKTRRGKKFFGCSRYPECKWASWNNPKKENQKQDEEKDGKKKK